MKYKHADVPYEIQNMMCKNIRDLGLKKQNMRNMEKISKYTETSDITSVKSMIV